ncbi:MAG: SMI1/KNR4 family protein, partial [Proteobacteria bacterium]|nr:SMI1/KNR4 family protein [Pseudomonadota bacterium]
MRDEHCIDAVLQTLARWSEVEPLRDSTRVRLICPQPQYSPQHHLHRLYIGLAEAEIAEIEAILGCDIPRRLREFYEVTNGARLFEGQVSISGLVTNSTRDPMQHGPISIDQENWTCNGFAP